MAILKHLSSKSSNYGNAVRYLMFEHDRLSGRPLLDDGHLVMRENFLIEGLECSPATFDIECKELNETFHKNHSYDEIKSHHYILSFDPRDTKESGLTMKKAQLIGMDFAKKNFPGHQAIVCTHDDGENHSGNMHVHIVINSLRKKDVDRQEYMERNCDSRAGYKHHVTKPYLRYLKQDLMNTCISFGLHQVDLLANAKERITDKEQWAKARGQEKLEKNNQELIRNGKKPKNSRFRTQKDELRDAIRHAALDAGNEKEFAKILKEKYGIELKISRGRYSYLHPERNKPITGRMLGEDCREKFLREIFIKNAHRQKSKNQKYSTEKTTDSQHTEQKPSLLGQLRMNQKLIAEQDAARPSRRQRINELQATAQAVAYLQENGYTSLEDFNEEYNNAKHETMKIKKNIDKTNTSINRLNEQLHYTGRYYAHKKTYQAFLHAANKGKFRSEHRIAISEYESARKWLQDHAKGGTLPSYEFIDTPQGKFPGLDKLKAARDRQVSIKQELYARYKESRQHERNLSAIYGRVDRLLNTPALDAQRRSHKHNTEL